MLENFNEYRDVIISDVVLGLVLCVVGWLTRASDIKQVKKDIAANTQEIKDLTGSVNKEFKELNESVIKDVPCKERMTGCQETFKLAFAYKDEKHDDLKADMQILRTDMKDMEKRIIDAVNK